MPSSRPPDQQFDDPLLASLYDDLDGERDDLDLYEAIIDELGVRRVLDVGCGTGVLATRLAERGVRVTGVDPAAAMLDVARKRSEVVTWLHGDATTLPSLEVDLATMTGNVAQVFVSDDDWRRTLAGVRRCLATGGHLAFETRDASQRAWERWDAAPPREVATRVGLVESWYTVLDVSLPLVTFRSNCRFLDGDHQGLVTTSDSTLCFRDRADIEADLDRAGFTTTEVRDAPDRPGLEFVFIARAI